MESIRAVLLPLLVIPIPWPGDDVEEGRFRARVDVRAKRPGVTFDPFGVAIRIEEDLLRPVAADRAPDRTDAASYVIEYPIPRPPERFLLEIDGLAIDGRPAPVRSVTFERAAIWRCHLMPITR